MKLPIITFAEYAAVSADGKLTIAGTIDGISIVRREGVSEDAIDRVPLPPVYLVAVLEGSIADGLQHKVGLRVLNEDQEVVTEHAEHGQFHFAVNRFGRPMRAQVIMRLHGLAVPKPGDYEFVLLKVVTGCGGSKLPAHRGKGRSTLDSSKVGMGR